MSENQSESVQEQKKKGGKIALAVGATLVVILAVVGLFFALGARNGEDGEAEGKVAEATPVPWAEKQEGGQGTIIDESFSESEPEDKIKFGHFEVNMTVDWAFDSETLTCEDAIVSNVEGNVYNMYFELVEESSNTKIYTSPLIEIGDYMEGLTLDTSLEPGKYTCVMVHHLLDPSTNQEIDGLDLSVDIEIF